MRIENYHGLLYHRTSKNHSDERDGNQVDEELLRLCLFSAVSNRLLVSE